ncbi:FtsX-like permease family protein [Pseudonocardia alaniniphila]|uniref:ABC transporter permease n=1 Tax=Pseudonocardia alaniniphila TaxID=75291 RepID=A0ABS9TLZ9_9PSEU|nr:FtsX-like permease family protein [Pseudonocardia alaniniphila]MCH6169533.1 ABC transporter permease [Pseudonocardia alaniniphila]
MAAVAATLLTETRRRPGRLLLTGLAITVATVFAAGTFLLGETLRGYLTTTVVKTPEATAAVVLPERMPEDARGADLVARVAAVDGVTDAVGLWTTYPTVSGAGSATTWHLASDPMGGPLTRLPGPILQGRLPAGPDEVAVGETTAARTGLAPGRTVTVDAGDAALRTVTVTGVVPLSDSAINTLVATPDMVAGLGGSLDQVDVAAAPGADAAALSGRVAAALGVPAAVRTGAEQRAAEVEDTSASVTAVLAGVGVFAGLAVVAGAVVVASTFRIVLTQRRTQMALLRCVGARRGQVVRAVLVEAVVTGLVAGVLGLGVALLAGYGLLAAMRAFGAEGAPGLVVWWPGLAGVLLVAVLATVLAGVAPALAAARIPPVAALGVADAADAGVPRAGRRIVVAAVLAAAAGALAGVALAMPGDGSLALVVMAFSGMIAFAALVVVGPVLVRGLVAVAGRPLAALGGAAARLAVANAAQVPRRTAATISVLALSVGLTSALLVGIQTTRSGAERNLAAQFPADVVVSAADAGSAASLAARLTADPRLAVRADGPTVFVNPAPGVSEDVARTAVEQGVGGAQGLMVQYAGDARAELDSVLGTAQLIGFGLVGMTALVAVVGVGVTLMLSVTERTRETGLLRAVGLSRRGVRSMVAWEAALSGAGAAVIGAVIGSVYGALGAEVLNLAEGPPALPFPSLAVLIVGVVVVAALAATVPAVRAGRVPPIRALQEA